MRATAVLMGRLPSALPSTGVLCLLLLAAGEGAQMPQPGRTGPPRVEVVGDSVRVRDLVAAVRGLYANGIPLDTLMVSGLQPGEERRIGGAEMRSLLAAAGVPAGVLAAWAGPDGVVVRRRSRVLSAADIAGCGEQAIRAQLDLPPGDRATITPVMVLSPLLVPLGPVKLEAAVRRPKLRGGLWIAEITVGEDSRAEAGDSHRPGTRWAIARTVRYRVRVAGQVLVTRRAIRRCQALGEQDVSLETRDLSGLNGTPIRTFDELVGRRASRAVSASSVVTAEWLESAPAVRRGDLILVTARVGLVSATLAVAALSDGWLGDVIRVRGEQSGSEFSARVSGPGRAEVVLPQ